MNNETILDFLFNSLEVIFNKEFLNLNMKLNDIEILNSQNYNNYKDDDVDVILLRCFCSNIYENSILLNFSVVFNYENSLPEIDIIITFLDLNINSKLIIDKLFNVKKEIIKNTLINNNVEFFKIFNNKKLKFN